MMASSYRFVLQARRSDCDMIVGDQESSQRAAEFLQRIRASVTDAQVPPCHIEILESIPSHAGLGSGTQLGLAVARAVSELMGERAIPAKVLAQRTGRGLRSAIGLHGFEQGGFLVDGGRAGPGSLGVLVSRIPFPEAWRLLLVSPPQSIGLSGSEEQQAFASQPPMHHSLTAELCRIALMDWLPGIIEADFDRAASAMFAFGMNVGRFFEPVQGGVFAHPLMDRLAHEVLHRGFEGVAQTSWGPTICVLCKSDLLAQELARDLAKDARWVDCQFHVAQGLNHGAEVVTSTPDH
jgi:beta-RFAP synthase